MKIEPQVPEALVIVAKYPEVGGVKTRLARYIGDELTCQLYISFIRDLQEKFGGRQRPLFWAYTPPESDFPSLVDARSQCFPQEGAWLGERLLNIFNRLFHQGFDRVAIMSSDSPHMPAEWIDEAFASLSEVDAVFAPADDGGYNLVGLKQTHDLFSSISMSTSHVLTETLERAHTLGLAVHLLPTSFDVDEIEDLEKLHRFLAQDGASLWHTRQILRRLGKA
ncbi:MAG: TIGR04282 family arsenosugar biosynthesis glycosyltransferase [Acidobacteria bacterium]|nr:TIGR04282 family arsenosugar biosynthesis glycosyltransferase [Acidobacteriota bacterium]